MYPRIFDLPVVSDTLDSAHAPWLHAWCRCLGSCPHRWIPLGYRRASAGGTQVSPGQSLHLDRRRRRVTIYSSQFEMGQGAYFGIATLVNEELDADWAQITVDGGYGNVAAYGNLAWGGAARALGGSTSMTSSWERYRTAGEPPCA